MVKKGEWHKTVKKQMVEKQTTQKLLINMLEKVGEFTLKGRCLGVLYDPKIPKELQKMK